MRIRISDPALLGDLCDHLSRQGCVAVEAGAEEVNVLIPGARSPFEAAMMVMTEIDLWRLKQASVTVSVQPDA